MKDRLLTRKNSFRKALRAQKLNKEINECYEFDNLHQYSKDRPKMGKKRYRHKTRNKGKRRNYYGNYAPSIFYKHGDQQKIDDLDSQMEEYLSEGEE